MTVKAKITSKGQITLPLEVRTRLGLRQGDQLEFDLGKTETVIRPVRHRENPLDKWVGIARGAFPGGSAEIDCWIREMRGDRDEEGD